MAPALPLHLQSLDLVSKTQLLSFSAAQVCTDSCSILPFFSHDQIYNQALASETAGSDRPRRRPSGHNIPSPSDLNLHPQHTRKVSGVSSSLPERTFAQPLAAIPGTPGLPPVRSSSPMSLSRTPSPKPNGGWTSRNLTDEPSDDPSGSPSRMPYAMNGYDRNDGRWAAARAKSQAVRGYPKIQTKNEGFFKRTKRQVSLVLPTFNTFSPQDRNWRDQEKLGRGRWQARGVEEQFSTVRTFLGNFLRKFKFIFLILGVVAILTTIMSQASESSDTAFVEPKLTEC